MVDDRDTIVGADDLEKRFTTPAALAARSDLTDADKIVLLERWRLDALRLSDSEQEGMGGGEHPQLGEIERLLLHLKGG